MGVGPPVPDGRRPWPISAVDPTGLAASSSALLFKSDRGACGPVVADRARVPVKALRSALAYAERELGIDRLLLRSELRTEAGKVFLDRYGELIELTASGQLALRRLFDEHLKRVEWNSSKFPVRLYPFLSAVTPSEERPIVIDPRIAFGRPVVLRKGVSTAAIAERVDAGESVDDIAADYELGPSEIEQAIVYERAA